MFGLPNRHIQLEWLIFLHPLRRGNLRSDAVPRELRAVRGRHVQSSCGPNFSDGVPQLSHACHQLQWVDLVQRVPSWLIRQRTWCMHQVSSWHIQHGCFGLAELHQVSPWPLQPQPWLKPMRTVPIRYLRFFELDNTRHSRGFLFHMPTGDLESVDRPGYKFILHPVPCRNGRACVRAISVHSVSARQLQPTTGTS